MASIIRITDYSDPALNVYARMTERQLLNRLHPDESVFIAESPTVIEIALKAGVEPISMLLDERHIEGKAAPLIGQCGNIPIYTADRETLSRLTGYPLTRGVLCAMRRPAPMETSRVCEGALRVAVLENIVDTTNIGAIFRSAAALGIDAVLLTPSCCDPLNRRAVRVSMGTVFQVPWARFRQWPEEGLNQLRDLGFHTVAMALTDRSLSIDDPLLKNIRKLAVVLGTEGDGLSSETIAKCDSAARIPMAHGVDSLNVAAASAVAFWELRRKS